MATKRVVNTAAIGAAMAAVLSVGMIGGVGMAAPGAVPDKDDGTVHLCFKGKQARNKDGGAFLRVYDSDTNTNKCKNTDKSLNLQTKVPPIKLTSGQFNLAVNTGINDGPYNDVLNFAIALPAKGTYLLTATLRGRYDKTTAASTVSCTMYGQLATNTSGVVAGTERAIGTMTANSATTNDGAEGSGVISQILTVTGPTTVKVQLKRSGTCTGVTTTLGADANGRSSINYVRISE